MKKILAFTLALAMVLSTWTPTFAASKEVEALANLKLLLNTTDAEVNADLTRAVGLAMVLKALGYTQDDANAKMAENTFVDLDKAVWVKGFAKLGEDLKITNGTSVEPKLFSPNWKLNERAFVAFLLRALGHDVDAAWAKAGELAKENGLTETVSENKLTKGEAAVIMYNALKAKVVGDEKGRTLAEKLVADKKLDKELAVANGLLNAEPEMLMVESATANNLKEVVVMFNGTVDADTAKKSSNYKVKGQVVDSVMLAEDNKTVTLKLKGTLVNKKEADLTVTGVKNVAGKVMDKATVKFMVNDVEIPVLKEVKVTGPKNFTLVYSEPIKVAPTVSLRQGKSTFGATSEGFEEGNKEINFKVYSSFQDGKEYVVAVGSVVSNDKYAEDFAGYKSTYVEETLTYTKDTTAPEVKLISADAKKVVFEFTKPVVNVTKGHFSHSYSVVRAKELEEKEGKYTAVFYKEKNDNALTPGKSVEVTVYAKDKDGKVIKDNWGNELKDTTFTVAIEKDSEAPTVTAVEAGVKGGNTEVKLTFSEELLKTEKVKLVLRDENGKEVNKQESLPDKKEVKFSFAKDYSGKTFTLVVTGAKDDSLAENKMDEYTESVTFTDKELKALADAKVQYFKKDATADTRGYLYITFAEEMDDSALDLENYRIGDYKLQGNAEFLEGNRKIVAIELTTDTSGDTKDTKTDMYVLTGKQFSANKLSKPSNKYLTFSPKLKDLAGNSQSEFTAIATIQATNLVDGSVDNDNLNVGIKSAVAKAVNIVEVEFDAPISSFNGIKLEGNQAKNTNYVLSTTAITSPEYQVVQVNKKSDSVLELLVEEYSSTDPAVKRSLLPADVKDIEVYLAAGVVSDVFGRTNAAVDKALTDKIAPSVGKIVYKDGSSHKTPVAVFNNYETGDEKYSGKPAILVTTSANLGEDNATAVLKIKFTEKLKGASISTNTFTLNNGWRVTSVTSPASDSDNDAVIVLAIAKAKGTADELKSLEVTQVSSVRDASTALNESEKGVTYKVELVDVN